MNYARQREYDRYQRDALIVEHLLLHRHITTAQAARLTGMSERTARRVLASMSCVLYMDFDYCANRWRLLDKDWSEDHITFG